MLRLIQSPNHLNKRNQCPPPFLGVRSYLYQWVEDPTPLPLMRDLLNERLGAWEAVIVNEAAVYSLVLMKPKDRKHPNEPQMAWVNMKKMLPNHVQQAILDVEVILREKHGWPRRSLWFF